MGLAALLALSVAAIYFRRQHRATHHERHVEKTLRALGAPLLHNVVLPDGIDGLAFIDYLLLTPKGIVVLTIKQREGLLFGGVNVDQWTQVVNRKTVKFNNPLYLQPQHRQAVEWNAPATDIPDREKSEQKTRGQEQVTTYAWVVFSNAGEFPKGIPADCCMIDTLAEEITPLLAAGTAPSTHLRHVWAHLQDLSVTSRATLGQQSY